MQVDQLFFGARRNLKEAQTQLHQLLELLQDGHPGIDASEVADLIKATAKAISEMDTMASDWKQQAQATQANESLSRDELNHYAATPLFRDEPQSLEEIVKGTSFRFDHLLSDLEDEGNEVI